MTKFKKVLFDIVVYSMLVWTILSAGYVSLPPEYQALIPQFNWLTALISGGTTGVLGLAGVTLKAYLSKAQVESDSKFKLLAGEYLQVVEQYKLMQGELTATKTELVANNEIVAKMIELLKVDLSAKLSNPLIDAKVKELIAGVINESE